MSSAEGADEAGGRVEAGARFGAVSGGEVSALGSGSEVAGAEVGGLETGGSEIGGAVVGALVVVGGEPGLTISRSSGRSQSSGSEVMAT